MAKINPHYAEVSENYMFADVVRRARAFADAHPGVEILRLAIGNTTEPLVPAVIDGLKNSVDKLSRTETYTGYGDEQGNTNLRQAIAARYGARGVTIDASEVFVSDGAKPDCANVVSIFSDESVVAIQDPVYPVYRDANTIAASSIWRPQKQTVSYPPFLPNTRTLFSSAVPIIRPEL